MKTFTKCAAIAGVALFAAGSTAWAQGYNPYPGTQEPYATNPGTQGSYTTNPSTQSYTGPGAYTPNQEGWNSGVQGTSRPNSGQTYSQARSGMGGLTTFENAEQELNKFGYKNVYNLKSMQGWSAEAVRNGQNVHVMIGDNGLIATFPGQ